MTQKRELGGLVISVKTTPEEAADIGEEARKRGLTILSVYGGEFPVAESLEAGIRGLRRLIASCVAARSKTLMVGGTGSTEQYDDYYKAIAECCPEAEYKGLQIVLKPHGGLNATGPQCRKAVERVSHRAFRLWYDPGNIFYYSDGKLDPVVDLRHVQGIVTGMCVKDFRMEERDGLSRKEVMITPGTGRVDFAAVLDGLVGGGFREGPLLIECLDRGAPVEITKEAKKAKALVEELVARTKTRQGTGATEW
jgi:sugar phosphate isomerase/epimerase